MRSKLRMMAIVGRPNVGKSAVFNRLAERRVAIVHEESGVTRDRLMREVCWRGERFDLVDTGGLFGAPPGADDEVVLDGIHGQVEAALDEAAVALLVTDGAEGVHPLDDDVARLLRSRGIMTLVLVNKCDTPAHDAAASDFARWGFRAYPVSALHGRGFEAPMRDALPALPPMDARPADHPLRVAIVGRPNVGKSSLINRLLKNDRVIVSDIPGTTRDSIEIPFTVRTDAHARHYVLVDTAGMRKMARIDTAVERYGHFRAERSIHDADVVVLVMDVSQGPTAYEKRIAALILAANKACVLVFNKWDRLDGATMREAEESLFAVMPFMTHCPLVCLSAATGVNVRRAVEAIDRVAANTRIDMPTGILNRVLGNAFTASPPPRQKGKMLKFFYATQTGKAPLRIRMFVNEATRTPSGYSDYLTRKLREYFGLEGVPVVFQFRSREPSARRRGSRR